MISFNDLKSGMTIQQDEGVLVVPEQSQNKTARSTVVVKVEVRNLRTESDVELSWSGDDKITSVYTEKEEMQYLYDTDDALVFMDNETHEQIEIPKDRLKWEMNFIKPDGNVNVPMFESEILGVVLPDRVALQTVECELAARGDIATSASKSATLEPGLETKVPLFIDQDEMVLVNTSDGKYSGRAKD